MITGDTRNNIREQEYWNLSTTELIQQFHTSKEQGLTSEEANYRLSLYGENLVKSNKKTISLSLLISQFKSPIIVIFIFTSILSFFLGQTEDALIIISIVIVSGLLGFWQEKGASDTISKLLAIVTIKNRYFT